MDTVETQSEPMETGAPLSIDSAASLMGKALNPGPDRGTNGQFQAKAPAEEAPKDDAKVVDLKTGKPAEAAKTEAVEEEDDDPEFEIAAEEGKEPVRRKLSQLWEGFERAEKLSKELEEVKTSAQRIPAEYTTQLEETVKTRGDYIKGLEAIARMIQPQRPSLEMLNPNSDKYDPDSYYHLARKFDADTEHLRRARAGIEEENKRQLADTEVLTKAQSARELEKLKAAWPEFDKDQKVRQTVVKEMAETYGFTLDEINAISDHRHLLVVRDAMELRALKAKQADAVKVVRAKPKLVKGAARSSTTDSKAAARSNAMAELQATGSMAAAAKALAGLI